MIIHTLIATTEAIDSLAWSARQDRTSVQCLFNISRLLQDIPEDFKFYSSCSKNTNNFAKFYFLLCSRDVYSLIKNHCSISLYPTLKILIINFHFCINNFMCQYFFSSLKCQDTYPLWCLFHCLLSMHQNFLYIPPKKILIFTIRLMIKLDNYIHRHK